MILQALYRESLIYWVRGFHINIASFLKRSNSNKTLPYLLRDLHSCSTQAEYAAQISFPMEDIRRRREEKRREGICGWNLLPHKLGSHGRPLQ